MLVNNDDLNQQILFHIDKIRNGVINTMSENFNSGTSFKKNFMYQNYYHQNSAGTVL